MDQPKQRHRPAANTLEPLPIDEIEHRYYGKWVLIEVPSLDEYHSPSAGRVLAHGTRKRVHEKLARLLAAGERPPLPYRLWPAGAFVRLNAWSPRTDQARGPERGKPVR